MSQRILRTEVQGQKATLLMGWDRPLQGYFMVIERTYRKLIYSNLRDKNITFFLQEPDYFIEKAKSFGIKIPHNMIVRLREDKKANTGNARSCFASDGTERIY